MITENGDIFAPKSVTGINQFQLRSSIKSGAGFTQSMYSSNPTISTTPNLNQSQRNPGQENAISPKINKSYEINYE